MSLSSTATPVSSSGEARSCAWGTARALGVSIFTEADSMEQLRERVRDAVHCHFEEAARPSVIRLHYVREQLIAV